jgi:hypothetical protein
MWNELFEILVQLIVLILYEWLIGKQHPGALKEY